MGNQDEIPNETVKLLSDKLLIENVSKESKLLEVILSTDEVKIYTVKGDHNWDVKYPFRIIYKNKQCVWVRCDTVSPSFDIAMLVYLQWKYIGRNTDFVNFTMKMLDFPKEQFE
jgi:hypothetical protein